MSDHSIIHSKRIFQALIDANIVPKTASRVVIDLKAGQVARVYVEQFGDERLLSVVPTLDGIEITSAPTAG